MDTINPVKQFSSRLKDAMLAAGLHSQRSTSGVCIHQLAEISGNSEQICRRYLKGEAIPEPTKLITIAEKLNVSPGWLLFGDNYGQHTTSNSLHINKHLLRYLFSRAASLYRTSSLQEEVSDFLMDVVNDISQINANEEQSKKIIDLALASANLFKAETCD